MAMWIALVHRRRSAEECSRSSLASQVSLVTSPSLVDDLWVPEQLVEEADQNGIGDSGVAGDELRSHRHDPQRVGWRRPALMCERDRRPVEHLRPPGPRLGLMAVALLAFALFDGRGEPVRIHRRTLSVPGSRRFVERTMRLDLWHV